MAHFSKPMDDLLLQTFTMQHWLEIEDDDETFNRLQLAATVLVIGSNEDHAPERGTDDAADNTSRYLSPCTPSGSQPTHIPTTSGKEWRPKTATETGYSRSCSRYMAVRWEFVKHSKTHATYALCCRVHEVNFDIPMPSNAQVVFCQRNLIFSHFSWLKWPAF